MKHMWYRYRQVLFNTFRVVAGIDSVGVENIRVEDGGYMQSTGDDMGAGWEPAIDSIE